MSTPMHDIYNLSGLLDKQLVTPELHQSNDFYGFASLLKSYAGISHDYQIKAVIEHAPIMGMFIWDVDVQSKLPAILPMSHYRVQFLKKKVNKAIIPIGPMITYAQHYLSEENLKKEKQRIGKNLLVFPPHSTHHVDTEYDIHNYCKFLEKIGKDFNTITICLYWKDILLKKAKYYQEHGFECVTAGHMFDPLFMSRLKSIIELSTITTSCQITSAFGYCILLGKPHYYHEFGIKYNAASQNILERDAVDYVTPFFRWVLDLFSELRDDITPKQREAVYHYFGGYDTKSPQEVLDIFRITEDMYRHPEKYFFLTSAGDITGQRRELWSAFRKKGTLHGKAMCPQEPVSRAAMSQNLRQRFLNLGCGQRYHPAWTNVDFTSTGPGVIAHDLTQGIPFESNAFDAVYHSHLLEHFAKDAAPVFMQECYRVLKPGGIIRVVVPDLENIARLYLILLKKSLAGDTEAQKRYEWILLELFDQMVRNFSGGAMLEYWRQNPMPAEDFVIERAGSEVKNAIALLRAQPQSPSQPSRQASLDPLTLGKFRLSGEVHQWMYDRYSLGKLLREAGFEDVRVCRANESAIPDWNAYLLDVEPDGSVRKPDSLFMEARKPQTSSIETLEPQSTTKTGTQRPKIAQICMQDFGGAGTAAVRLHDGLRLIGANNTLYVHNIQRWRPGTVPLAGAPSSAQTNQRRISPAWNAFGIHNERLLAKYPQRSPYLEIFTDTWSAIRISQIPEIQDADILNLHWIAGTVDIAQEVDFLKTKKIVWTLHDMNPFTGGCHYAAGCPKYIQACGSCPQLGSQDDNDLSRQIWARKKAAYRELDITLVTPSQWLARCVQQSALLSAFPVHVIPYGVPTDIFKPFAQGQIRESLQIPRDALVILFGADSVTNARKGFVYLLRALEQLKDRVAANTICLATFGQNAQSAVQHLGFPTFAFDYVEDESKLALIYSLADVTVIPSLEDNLPNIVLESLACGTPVVGFDVGGIPDMVEHHANGYLAQVGDVGGLMQGILWVLEQKHTGSKIRIKCRETVLNQYNLLLQASRYQKLYEDLMSKHTTT
jgi:glycosyltransferase involved in cell wall biosynthesis/predicted SAM-dependent methyltransferase